MGRRRKPGLSLKAVRQAISAGYGNISAMAEALGVSRQTVYNYLETNPALKTEVEAARQDARERMDEIRDVIVDLAERALYADVKSPENKGHQRAYLFVLETLGKDRGWGRNVDVTSGGAPLRMYGNVTPDEWDGDNDGE